MRKLIVFNNVSADGFFVDQGGDMSWAHGNDPEFHAFTKENAKQGGTLLFGRITYDLMAGYWPTPAAAQQNPEVADGMNRLPKIVFSRTMQKPQWSNTRLVTRDLPGEVSRLKEEQGTDLVVMGSGTIVSQLAQAGLVDEYQLVVVPVVLGGGRTLFEGVKERFGLKLLDSRSFPGGNLVLRYAEAKGRR